MPSSTARVSCPPGHAPCVLLPAAARVAPGYSVPNSTVLASLTRRGPNRRARYQPTTDIASRPLRHGSCLPLPAAARAAPSLGRRPITLVASAAAYLASSVALSSLDARPAALLSLDRRPAAPPAVLPPPLEHPPAAAPAAVPPAAALLSQPEPPAPSRLALSLDGDEGSVAARSTPANQRRRLLPDAAALWGSCSSCS